MSLQKVANFLGFVSSFSSSILHIAKKTAIKCKRIIRLPSILAHIKWDIIKTQLGSKFGFNTRIVVNDFFYENDINIFLYSWGNPLIMRSWKLAKG